MRSLLICDDFRVGDLAPFCQTNGWGIEIQSFHDPKYIIRTPDAIGSHRVAISKIGLRSLHGSFGDLCPGSFDSMVRDVARNRFEMGYEVALKLDVSHMVFHHGYVPGTSAPSGWLKRCTMFWNDFLESKPENISFHVENMVEHDPELISDVVASINRPNVDVCLDIGHAHSNSKTPVLKWIERFGKQIGYLHLHDNDGEKDEHLGLGEGSMPLKEICHALLERAPDALWAIEAEGPGIQKSIDWLKENGFLDS